MSEITVLIVEDHLAVRKGLELLLRARGLRVVGLSSTAEEAIRMVEARRPDVVVVDLGLAQASGTEVAHRILERDPKAGVLIYTGRTDPGELELAAQSGARGFALKSVDSDVLVKAICTVADGGVWIDPVVAATLAPRPDRSGVLSPREREILDLLASGMTGEEAAERLVLSPETVRTHIRNAMRKLGANTRVHAIALAVRHREIAL